MKVRDLIEILQALPPDMPIAVEADPRHVCGVRVQTVFTDAAPGQRQEAWLVTAEDSRDVA
ncbi:hypothetical protein LLG90_13570 [Aromatoleum toluclasticum]|uniref:hypothetical protein n=1 Tax=Aromatoleum toluclasticum TaxID=92003 RepID=UPI001D1888C6|nr:hypothetical protein [Aromatoleum toluclasticum]MCC4116384.1 hypothetical protein [Aromatoleum toluclasticum]